MTKKTAHLTIDLADVQRAGGVPQAIAAWCDESDDTSCGVIGPSFSTSGPGPGWSIQHDESDFAARAVEGGALYYIDIDDGRMIAAEEVSEDEQDEDGEWPADVIHDLGGTHSRLGDWSDNSVVRVECPSIDDALEHPAIVAEMAQAVIDHHHVESDCGEWRMLIESIRNAAEALEDIDVDDLAE